MPDKDLFQRSFAPGWKKVFNLAKDAAVDDVDISVACLKAAAKTLRETSGCPGFNEIAKIVGDVDSERKSQPLFTQSGVFNVTKSLSLIRQVEEQNKQNRMTKIAARAARSLLAREIITENDNSVRQNLAEKICEELVDHHFFGRGRNYLAESRFGNFTEERNWENTIKEKSKGPFSKLASILAKNPNSKNIRVPKQTRIRMSTRELLDQQL